MAALVAMVDEQVGRILEALESWGILDDTLIVFASDHGDFSSAYGVIGKSWCMDEVLLRIRLIVSGRGGTPGTRCDGQIQNCDILPFLLDYAGLDCPSRVQGRSFKAAFSDPSRQHRDAVFACQSNEYSKGRLVQSMVIREGWKYVE